MSCSKPTVHNILERNGMGSRCERLLKLEAAHLETDINTRPPKNAARNRYWKWVCFFVFSENASDFAANILYAHCNTFSFSIV